MARADRYTPSEVVAMVERVEAATAGRRKRMDEDYRLQRGDAYDTNTDGEGNPIGTDFRSFTANEAGAFVKKVVAVLAAAQLLIDVPYGPAQAGERQRYDLKERFASGLLVQADDLLVQNLEVPLLDQLCWYSPNRGWIAIRALLMNQEDGTTVATAKPWDPRNVYWEMGRGAPLWVCHRSTRPAGAVLAEFPRANLNAREDADPVVVYDMYTAGENALMTAEGVLKRWTQHGSPRLPVVIVPVPTQPQIWSDTGSTTAFGLPDTLDDYGEGILATNRPLFNHLNEVMSITLELMAKAREPAGLVFTDEEDTEMDEHPSKKGGVKYLAREDKYQELPPPETTRDALQFMSAVTGMLQRGGLPYSAYGEVNFTLSGYAITQLNQQMMTVIGPQTRAIGRAVRGVLDLWVDQFATGQFNPMTVRGMGRNKDYLQTTIVPEQLANLPPFRVQLVAQLPQDDISRLAAAQKAREGDVPFLPDRWLQENFLHLPDTMLIDSQIKEQLAERAAPAAMALTLARGAFENGKPEIGQVYLDAYIQMKLQSKMVGAQANGGKGPEAPAPSGLPPTTLPFMAEEGVPVTPNPPTGAEGQPGMPRQTGNEGG